MTFLHYLVGKKYKSTAWQKLKEKSVRQQLEEVFNCCEERMKRKKTRQKLAANALVLETNSKAQNLYLYGIVCDKWNT